MPLGMVVVEIAKGLVVVVVVGGGTPVGDRIVNVTPFDLIPAAITTIVEVPGAVKNVFGTVALSTVGLAYEIGNGVLFQYTAGAMKLLPLTVNVKVGLPAKTPVGEIELMVGAAAKACDARTNTTARDAILNLNRDITPPFEIECGRGLPGARG